MKRGDGYEPKWDFNLQEGKEGESLVWQALHLPAEGGVEVKRKSYRDFRFYVETSQSPPGSADYKPSGINTSKAAFWAWTIDDTGIVVLIPNDRVRWAARSGSKTSEKDGDNPTWGRMIGAAELLPDYETYGLEEACGRCGGRQGVGPGRVVSGGEFVFLCRKCWWNRQLDAGA